MSGRLSGKAVVILGGSSGLGRSAAQACVVEGAHVVVVGRDATKVEAAVAGLGAAARGVVGDAADADVAGTAIAASVANFGRFDGLYHVAGGSGRTHGDGPLDQISDEGWRYTLDQNLTSLFHSNRAAARQFLEQETPGSVVNLGSVLADSPSPQFFATHAYAAAKAAIVGLTTAAAAYYADRDIRFNVIEPALVQTPMAERAANDREIMAYVRSKQPLDGGRIGQPADVDAAVVYFLSDESRFVTGQVLKVDGGWSITDGQRSAVTTSKP